LFSGIVIDEEPSTFDEAWNHDDPKARGELQDSMKKKLCDMNKQQFWEIIKNEVIPENRTTIKCKCIFKINRNGVFRARLVACGYSQIPGIDFNESFTSVFNDDSFRIMLIAKLNWNLEASIVNLKTLFLNGEFKRKYT
jgi:hypothetical protein